MLPSEELALIYKKQQLIITEEVANLFTKFLKVSPVDTGAFRSAWEVEQNHNTSWTISNDMEYATILFDGHRLVVDRWFGSDQWQEGGEVMIERFNRLLEKKLNKVKV